METRFAYGSDSAMTYQWPTDIVLSALDRSQPVRPVQDGVQLEAELAALGLDESLIGFFAPLMAMADGATLFDQSLRMHPLQELADWNRSDGWKQFEPQKVNRTFYFCSNAFGDQLGLPIDGNGKILNDRVGILWVERCEYQEAMLEWRTFIARLAAEDAMRRSFLRRSELDWAATTLGVPRPWECFSSKVPPILGGPDTIDNLSIQSMAVHVAFSLQVIGQALQRTVPGDAVGTVELRDNDGRVI